MHRPVKDREAKPPDASFRLQNNLPRTGCGSMDAKASAQRLAIDAQSQGGAIYGSPE